MNGHGIMADEGIPAGRFVSLTGKAGEAYGFLRQGQVGWQPNYFELYFEGVKDDGGEAGKKEITFSIPVLLLKEEGRAGVKVPVLRREESWELNQVVTLGRFELTLVRAKVIPRPDGENLRVYVNLGPIGEETLEFFSLEAQSWSARFNEESGQAEYFEVELPENARHVQVTLASPVYSVEGPWEFTFEVE